MAECRTCNASIEPFMDFGRMPIPNAFLTKEQFDTEFFFDMRVASCPVCQTFQVTEVPKPDQMFHGEYAYVSGTSKFMTRHFEGMANELIAKYLNDPDPFVVEIGCNDGITLQNFSNRSIRHIGVEPSENVAAMAQAKGINVVVDFFSAELADRIVGEYGNADVVITTNVLHNIENKASVAEGVAKMLKLDGVFVSEDPYLGTMITRGSYDQIYAEHMYIWSINSINFVFASQGMEIFDVEPYEVHGGCMRYFVCRKGRYMPTDRFLRYKEIELDLNLGQLETYIKFRETCEQSRDRLMGQLEDLRRKNHRVVGYGATAKSATIINYCNITRDHVSAIFDSTPTKQHKFSPGAHIPVRPPAEFMPGNPEYAVLFAWNHFAEINAKEQEFVRQGGRWIFPIEAHDPGRA